jgi:hypothetical protein
LQDITARLIAVEGKSRGFGARFLTQAEYAAEVGPELYKIYTDRNFWMC